MKVLVGQFVTESNENVPDMCKLENFDLAFGEDCIKVMQIRNIFEEEGIEIIPSIYANGGSSGIVDKNGFDYIEKRILDDIKNNIRDIDGIYLMLHGASEVKDLEGGSGDHHILKEVRKLVGPYLPIAIVCDPHGNLSKEYVENATIIRSYRESPHTDIFETMQRVAKMLVGLLNNRQNITPVYRKLPLILGGEQSVSTDEPVKSINRFMNELEKDTRILSCSWHVGYLRHDCEVAGCGVVVIPSKKEHQSYANEIADQLYQFIWEKRHEFHYTGLTAKPDEALKMAIEFDEKPVFITDSGDNVTSGANGGNTFILRQVIQAKTNNKKFLFAAINDAHTHIKLEKYDVGDKVKISLGMSYDELSKSVDLNVLVKAKGKLRNLNGQNENAKLGECITVSIVDYNIDIIVTNCNITFAEHHQFNAAGVDWDDYDIIVVKQGYIFPELKEKGKLSIMSLTMGTTPQDTTSIPFKRIMRPMYPIDEM